MCVFSPVFLTRPCSDMHRICLRQLVVALHMTQKPHSMPLTAQRCVCCVVLCCAIKLPCSSTLEHKDNGAAAPHCFGSPTYINPRTGLTMCPGEFVVCFEHTACLCIIAWRCVLTFALDAAIVLHRALFMFAYVCVLPAPCCACRPQLIAQRY